MAKGHHGEEEVGFIDPSANKKGCCEGLCNSVRGLCHFIYNPKTHLVMGRNWKQWIQLLTFYIVFYAFLIGFWIACLVGFLSTTNVQMPSLTGFQSMLKLNPAMGYRPQPDFENNLIWFNSSNLASSKAYLDDVNKFLEPYFNESVVQSQLLNCNYTGNVANQTAACQFRPKEVAPLCFPEPSKPFTLGFGTGKPCVALKMNRIIGWMPTYFNGTYMDIKVRCSGENEGDKETLGAIEYYPGGSDVNGPYGIISAKYLPYMNQPTYLSPLVFARFANIKPFTIALVWCQFDADAMNFVPGAYWTSSALTERSGGAHFEILMDTSNSTLLRQVKSA